MLLMHSELNREMHKERIKNMRTAYKRSLKSLERIENIKDRMDRGSVMGDGMRDLDAQLKHREISEILDTYLQEAIDDGYPELTI